MFEARYKSLLVHYLAFDNGTDLLSRRSSWASVFSTEFTVIGLVPPARVHLREAYRKLGYSTVKPVYNDIGCNDIRFVTISSRAFDYFWCRLMIFAI